MAATRSIDQIFAEALACAPGPDRTAYLNRVCEDDEPLRKRLERLLRAYGDAQSFLESPAMAVEPSPTIDQPLAEKPGTQIGPYKLLQQIGEGGMGVVYMAEQSEPVQRRVALKIIKPGMDSRQVIARFEAERQALAMMDHPNISKVLDGGTTASGRPYFVMELVKGEPITKYCDERHLTPRQRLELLLPVCQAIQHAHQKGIIHRDIKPTNVLVAEYDEQPVPKVIDFGVAKAVSHPLTERTMFTGLGQIVGTLEYMSPEQAKVNQLDIDTRSDIYSLGVLLYELLTGSTPFDKQRLRSAAFDEMLRIIREEEPVKPSTRLSESNRQAPRADADTTDGKRSAATTSLASIAAVRGTDPARLTKLIRGELDWIVMKALEKDRNRRYETASALAADLQNYLNDDPVIACPPSVAYRFAKFARRHQGRLAAACVLAVALLVSVSAIGWAVRDRVARHEEAQRDQATRQTKLTGQLQLILDQVARLESERKWPEALDAAQRASDLVAGGEADVEAAGRVQEAIDNLKFVQLLDEIRASRSESSDETRFDFRGTVERYLAAFQDAGIELNHLSSEEAAKKIRSRSAIAAALAPALDDWAVCCQQMVGGKGEADSVWEVAGLVDPDPWRQQVRAALRTIDEETLQKLAESPEVIGQPAATLTLLEVALRERGRMAAALAVLTLAQRQHPTDFWVHYHMAQAMEKQDPPNFEQAASCYRAALAVRPRSAAAWNNLGNAQKKLNKLDDAVASYQRAIELDPKYFMAHANLGLARYKQEKRDEAISSWRRAIELYPQGALNHSNLGNALLEQGNLDEAITCFQKAVELQPRFSVAHFNLGAALAKQQKLDEAIVSFRTAIEIEPKFVLAHQRLAAILFQKGDFEAAAELIQKVIALSPKLPAPHLNLGVAFKQIGKEREAIASLRQALELQPNYPEACISLARLLTTCSDAQLRDSSEGLTLAKKAVVLAPQSAEAWQVLGAAQYRSVDATASIAALEKSIALQASPQRGNAWQRFFLAMAHWQLGDKEKARGWYDLALAQMKANAPMDAELLRVRVEAEALLQIKTK